MKPFDLEAALKGAPVVTRDGRKVPEVHHLKTVKGDFPVVCVLNGRIIRSTVDGKYFWGEEEHGLDLFMAPVVKEVWVNLYAGDDCGYLHPTEEQADCSAKKGSPRLGGKAHRITWEEE